MLQPNGYKHTYLELTDALVHILVIGFSCPDKVMKVEMISPCLSQATSSVRRYFTHSVL
jgi:hypothetical protein